MKSTSTSKLIVALPLVLLFFVSKAQNVGIGTPTPHPSAKLEINDPNRGLLISRVSLTDVNVAAPVITPAIGLLVYNNNIAVAGGNGVGFYYWEGVRWIKLGDGPGNTLDMAYDEGGPGVGRTINATDGTVVINGDGGLDVSAINPIQNSAIKSFSGLGAMSSDVNVSYVESNSNNILQGIRSLSNYTTAIGTFDGSYGVLGITRHLTNGTIDLNNTLNSNNKAVGVGGSLGSTTSYTGSVGDVVAAIYGTTGNHNTGGGSVIGPRLYAGLFQGNGRILGLWGENSAFMEFLPNRQTGDYLTGIMGYYNASPGAGNNNAAIGTGDPYMSIEAEINGSNNLVLQNRTTGNVGIGTNAPSQKLDVNGTIRMRPGAVNGYIIQGDAAGNMSWVSPNSIINTSNEWHTYGNFGTNPSTDFLGTLDNQSLVFRTNNQERVRITNTGNVGMGTANPSAKLDVVGVLELSNVLPADPGQDIVRLGDGGTQLQVQTNYGFTRVGPANANYAHFYTDRSRYYFDKKLIVDEGIVSSYNENLSLQTSQIPRITVLNTNGYVGLGTTNPIQALHVTGNGLFSALAGFTTGPRLVTADNFGVLGVVADGASGDFLTIDGTGNMAWTNTLPSDPNAWSLTGNAGTDPSTNFLGTTDAQNLIFRTNNTENARIHSASGNVSIGSTLDVARLYVNVPSTNTTTSNGIFSLMDGATTSATYGMYSQNNSSTNNSKYGIRTSTDAEGTGSRYGLYNQVFQNTASNGTAYGAYNYLNSYGTGNHRASYNYLYHSGTGVSTQNYASYNLINIATSTNTSTIYGEYTNVDFSAGTSYGEYKRMNSNASYTSDMYGDYNQMIGSGNGISYGVYNDFDNTGTGAKYGIRNEFADVGGTKYGVYNRFDNGTATGTIYGTYNGVFNDGPSTKYGTYNTISGGDGLLRGSYNVVTPAITNASTIYGVYSNVSSNGTGTHYGIYSTAPGGTNDYAAMFNAGNVVMNEIGGNYDVRIESDTRQNMVLVDASADLMRVGNDPTGDFGNGATVNSIVVDYVADFDNGLVDGTAIGIGSVEYLLDASSLTTINNNFAPSTNGTRTLGTSALRWSTVYATNGTINTSDARKKKNIRDLNYGLSEVMSLRPVSYQWRSDLMGITPIAPNEKETKLGFVAQEVQNVLPEIVKDKEWLPISEDRPEEYHLVPMETLGMSYTEMTPVLVKAIQEQQSMIDNLKKENNNLKERLDRIEKLLLEKN